MIELLGRRRARGRLAELKRRAGRIDRERMPLDFARAARDVAELCAETANRADAVRWYGHAIDAYLHAGLTGAAAAMCRKLIDFEPRVIRARATLAMLHLAAGRDREAIEEIRRYVEATVRKGDGVELTRHRLRVFAEVAEDVDVRTAIGDSLRELGTSDGPATHADPATSPSDAASNDHDRWNRLLDAVLLDRVP